MAAPYLRMTVAVFVILSVAKESHGEKADCITLSFRGSVATERILPFCHSEAKAEESHERKVGTAFMGCFTFVQHDSGGSLSFRGSEATERISSQLLSY